MTSSNVALGCGFRSVRRSFVSLVTWIVVRFIAVLSGSSLSLHSIIHCCGVLWVAVIRNLGAIFDGIRNCSKGVKIEGCLA